MEMEQLMEQFTEKAWLIFIGTVLFFLILLGGKSLYYWVKNRWKMIKKE